MSFEKQVVDDSSNYLAFSSKTIDDNKTFRNNFQYRPYNRNRNQRNPNYRPFDRQNDNNSYFGQDNCNNRPGFNHGFRNNFRGRPNFTPFQNQRNVQHFKQFNKNGGHNQQNTDQSIQNYFHKSMIEDPWSECHKYRNGGKPTDTESAELQSQPID